MSAHPDLEQQHPNSRVDSFTEQLLFDTWQNGSPGDMARISIHFFIGMATIDIWHWGHEDHEWVPKRHVLHLDIRAKNLPKLATALASAVRFGLERGFIPARAVEAELEQRPDDAP
jgi:hypothetical protein